MNNTIKIVLVGIGGYGGFYVDEILNRGSSRNVQIAGVVDPKPENCRRYREINELKIPIYNRLEDFYTRNSADVAIISSPIHFHKSQSCLTMEKGSNVLCEKPAAATVQDVNKMIDISEKTGKTLSIGFQWSFTRAVIEFKKDIISGKYGQPKRFRTLVAWPRDKAYFSRSWAARRKAPNGEWVLDSVVMNATAHYLHNMLFVLGDSLDSSVKPKKIAGEVYRANKIENFDTVAARIMVEGDIELLYYATHAVKDRLGPVFQYEFEKGKAGYAESEGILRAVFNDGTVKVYGSPNQNAQKLWRTIEAVRTGGKVPCNIKTALPHIICVNGIQESVSQINDFGRDIVRTDNSKQITYVEGLFEDMKHCYDKGMLPGELKMSWAKTGREINVENYNRYPVGDISQ